MISKSDASGTTTYEYDYENRLIKITYPDTSVNTFEYDGDGKRRSKTDSSGTTLYLWDSFNLLMKFDGSGSLRARYTQKPDIDAPIFVIRDGIISFYHFDGLGSITALTDTNQNVTTTYIYDAFGNILVQTGTTNNFHTFTSRELDSDSELMYYRSRYYYPAIGRFITMDLEWGNMEDPLSLNRYVYLKNNPVNYIDPFGLLAQDSKKWEKMNKKVKKKIKKKLKEKEKEGKCPPPLPPGKENIDEVIDEAAEQFADTMTEEQYDRIWIPWEKEKILDDILNELKEKHSDYPWDKWEDYFKEEKKESK